MYNKNLYWLIAAIILNELYPIELNIKYDDAPFENQIMLLSSELLNCFDKNICGILNFSNAKELNVGVLFETDNTYFWNQLELQYEH